MKFSEKAIWLILLCYCISNTDTGLLWFFVVEKYAQMIKIYLPESVKLDASDQLAELTLGGLDEETDDASSSW